MVIAEYQHEKIETKKPTYILCTKQRLLEYCDILNFKLSFLFFFYVYSCRLGYLLFFLSLGRYLDKAKRSAPVSGVFGEFGKEKNYPNSFLFT